MQEKPESEILSQNLIRALIQLKQVIASRSRAQSVPDCASRGFKHGEVMFLFRLKGLEQDFPEGISVTQMSERMGVKPPSVTSVVTALEEKGMIARSMDAKDRRIIRIRLTDAGNRFIDENKMHVLIQVKGLVEYLGPEKSKMLAELANDTYTYYLSKPHDQT